MSPSISLQWLKLQLTNDFLFVRKLHLGK